MRLWLFLLFIANTASYAAIDAFQFNTPADEQRFHALNSELRCPKCQNQNIADSDAPIAKDLRAEVYRMVTQGAPDSEIVDFLVTRYGDFVLYRPKINSQTWLLWYGPYLFLGTGLVIILFIIFKRRPRQNPLKATLDENEQAQLSRLLKQDKE